MTIGYYESQTESLWRSLQSTVSCIHKIKFKLCAAWIFCMWFCYREQPNSITDPWATVSHLCMRVTKISLDRLSFFFWSYNIDNILCFFFLYPVSRLWWINFKANNESNTFEWSFPWKSAYILTENN